MTAATPPFPEAALRAVLAGTVAAWARPDPSVDEASAEDEPRRVYVDAFAGAELQLGTGVRRGAGCETRAAAVLRSLDGAGARPTPCATAIFVEEDPAHLQRVYIELEDLAGGERLRATRDFASLGPGDVSLTEASFAEVAADVARFAAGARTLVFASPPAARLLPWDALRHVLAIPGATVLIRFPHQDFGKQSPHTGPLADLPGFVRRIVEGCSALLGDPKHTWLPAWRAAASDEVAAALDGVLERFRALLASAAGDRIVESVVVETAEGERAWLFLVTPDPAVAHALNTAARRGGLADPAASAEAATVTLDTAPTLSSPDVEVLDLFPADVPEPPTPITPEDSDIASLAASLGTRFAGSTLAWREIQHAFVSTDVKPDELRKALAVLRRRGRAVYHALKSDGDEVQFPSEPVPRHHPKRRRKASGEVELFAVDG